MSKLFKARRAKPPQNRSKLLVQAIESIRDYAIFLLDPEGHILTWNAGAERLKGYQADEIIGQHFSNFYTDFDRDRGYPAFELKEAKKFGRYEDEGWRVRKDGTLFWASVIITKLTSADGELLGFSKVTRDLTERRMSEERLRQSEERFRLLVESVRDYAIFMLDPDGRIISWNEGARKIKGYEQDEVLGKHFSIFYSKEDQQKPAHELKEALRLGRFEDEGWRVRKDGTRLWANVVITAIRDKNRNLIGFSKVTRDLTERKEAEIRLQKAHDDLEGRVAERTAALATANAELKKRENALKDAVEMRDEFLSVASHELKTPITSLKMQMQMLRRRTRPNVGEAPDAEKVGKSLDVSLRQVDRLTGLVEDLLDVARLQAKKLSFHFAPGDLRALVDEVVERLHDQIEAAGCRVSIDGERSVQGQFDRFRMDQVLVNLMTNAIKYAPGSPIRISLQQAAGRATIQVSDEGPGIAKDKQPRIFDRFERATSSRNISGLGLGLFISKQIIEGHHGSIRVESTPDQGSTFVVEIPLDLGPAQQSREAIS